MSTRRTALLTRTTAEQVAATRAANAAAEAALWTRYRAGADQRAARARDTRTAYPELRG